MKGMSYREPLADMESDGVYFNELLIVRDVPDIDVGDICGYSGLPSVKSYVEEEKDEIILGHS